MPLSGEAKREANKRAYERRKATRVAADPQTGSQTLRPREMRVIEGIVQGKSTRQALKDAGFSNGHSGSMEARLKPGGDLAHALSQLLEQEEVGMRRLIRHAGDKLNARRLFNAAKVITKGDGSVVKVTECITADDNDAQLRANELLTSLHERAGTIPAASATGQTGSAITVNILSFDPHVERSAVEVSQAVVSVHDHDAPGE